MKSKQIRTALISVYHKDGLDPVIRVLQDHDVRILSTGGTLEYIDKLGADVDAVEDLTGYPSILGGRVKTLHPKIFGGILQRSDNSTDRKEAGQYEIPSIDLVIVDLYPFEETVASGGTESEIIEKIDIGGISLIRAAAKNFNDVMIVSSRHQYTELLELLDNGKCSTSLSSRRHFATMAFDTSSHYDTAIFNYFNREREVDSFKLSYQRAKALRYGENPHQKGFYYGDLEKDFEQLHGKEISYNNLLDIDAAVSLIEDFDQSVFAIIKHTNACGLALSDSCVDAYKNALAGDPVSAFGGILATNLKVDQEAAGEINQLFFEVLIAPEYTNEALEILESKKNRILLIQKTSVGQKMQLRSLLNGSLVQDRDLVAEAEGDLQVVTRKSATPEQIEALLLANKVVKHSKSNAIVLARPNQLISSGAGQTSRVDALNQAIEKARKFDFDLRGAVMASDAFFPFPDCVEIAHKAGISAVIQPGGSIKDQLSIDYCDTHGMSMVFTGIRHFKH